MAGLVPAIPMDRCAFRVGITGAGPVMTVVSLRQYLNVDCPQGVWSLAAIKPRETMTATFGKADATTCV
ncbi:hypothetical protein CHELA20_53310 [Hyphomicrobiales bacterium]|nr:hypothetical protein CHELA41_21615 [Hyphomicrobiales bacterium]CAH1683994.1 hypothetical protein CHELA20_53310 [Hyphomicrobiales bacterium]